VLSGSPWTNPFDAEDINSDGVITSADYTALSAMIETSGSMVLAPSAHPSATPLSVSYPDVDANFVIDHRDLEQLAASLFQEGEPSGEAAADASGPRLANLRPAEMIGPVNEEMAEGEDYEWFLWMEASGSLRELDQNGLTILIQRTGPTTNALTVGLTHNFQSAGLTSDDYQFSMYGEPIASYPIVIPAGELSIEVTISAVDDTATEQPESFNLYFGSYPLHYGPDPTKEVPFFTVTDDEWRWISPETSTTNFAWDPEPQTFERAFAYDAVLTPHGSTVISTASPTQMQVVVSASASAVYSGTYTASTGTGLFSFTCDWETGDIEAFAQTSGITDNQAWVSAAFEYSYFTSQASADQNTAQIQTVFHAGVGVTFGDGTVQNNAHAGDGSISPFEAWPGQGSWADVHDESGQDEATHEATLRCSRPSQPE
jgi:hypothetical protein